MIKDASNLALNTLKKIGLGSAKVLKSTKFDKNEPILKFHCWFLENVQVKPHFNTQCFMSQNLFSFFFSFKQTVVLDDKLIRCRSRLFWSLFSIFEVKKYYIVVGRERLFSFFFLGQVNMLVLLTFFTLRAREKLDAIWSKKQTIYSTYTKSSKMNVHQK